MLKEEGYITQYFVLLGKIGIAVLLFYVIAKDTDFYKKTFISKSCYKIKERNILFDTTKSSLVQIENSNLYKKTYTIDTSYKYKVEDIDSKVLFHEVFKNRVNIGHMYCESMDNLKAFCFLAIPILFSLPFIGFGGLIIRFFSFIERKRN